MADPKTIYHYKDKDGLDNFTDQLTSIPEQYRASATKKNFNQALTKVEVELPQQLPTPSLETFHLPSALLGFGAAAVTFVAMRLLFKKSSLGRKLILFVLLTALSGTAYLVLIKTMLPSMSNKGISTPSDFVQEAEEAKKLIEQHYKKEQKKLESLQ